VNVNQLAVTTGATLHVFAGTFVVGCVGVVVQVLLAVFHCFSSERDSHPSVNFTSTLQVLSAPADVFPSSMILHSIKLFFCTVFLVRVARDVQSFCAGESNVLI
jgi:hypothetical protein